MVTGEEAVNLLAWSYIMATLVLRLLPGRVTGGRAAWGLRLGGNLLSSEKSGREKKPH